MSQPKRYKPGWFSIAVMTAGFAVIVLLKFRRNGWAASGWMDVGFYLIAPIAIALIGNLFFAGVTIDEEAIEMAGLFSRKRFALADIEKVETAKGADVKLRLRDGRWVSLPSWVGADGWGIAASLRQRIKATELQQTPDPTAALNEN
jgi:hypothetical protein